MKRRRTYGWQLGLSALALSMMAVSRPVIAQEPQETPLEQAKHVEDDKSVPVEAILPFGSDVYAGPGSDNLQVGQHDNGRGGNTFVNDPCLDPAYFQPNNLQKTVQSETELAVLNIPGSMGKKIVAGFNDSYGFYNNREGLSGYSYSTDGGNTWIDGGGLPPLGDADQYFGDPVVVVHNASQTFYYSSIYVNPQGLQTMSVNRGRFVSAPPSSVESISNTRCLNHPELYQIPDPPKQQQERVKWDPPVEAVQLAGTCHPVPNRPPPGTHIECDALDKEWLYVSQGTGELYMTYTRFTPEGETPIEVVRSKDGGATWEGPFVIVPNLADTFNQATQIVQTSTGRLVVTWTAQTFSLITGQETEDRVESSFSDNDGTTWSPRTVVSVNNPQSEPPGYNRGRSSILNAPYLNYGNGKLYVTYFSGKGALPIGNVVPQADIYVSRSIDNGVTWEARVKVNDDNGMTSHVFPTLQVDKQGQVYVGWSDRRNDPINNVLTDVWANVSKDGGVTYGPDRLQTDVATTWFVRRDAAPNFGDYNSSELLGDNQFVLTWADGRFPAQDRLDPTLPATNRKATPDMIFTIANGLGTGSTK
jgi:BNR repeat-like domain